MDIGSVWNVANLTPGASAVFILAGAVLGGLIKAWPVLTKQATDAKLASQRQLVESEIQKDKQRHDETVDFRARIDALERRVGVAEQRSLDMEGRWRLVIAAYRMVVSELHRKDPKNVVIMHAQALLSPDMMAELPDIETGSAT